MRLVCVMFFLLPTQAYALINGKPLLGYRDLVRITLGSGDSICTGFFVNPTTVITAAHCFYSYEDGKLLEAQSLETKDNEVLAVKILSLIPHPEYYREGWSTNDIGIIKTTPNKFFRGSFPLAETSPPIMGTARMMGAGKIQLEPKQYGRSEGDNYYLQLGKFFFSLGGTSVAPNDSGGPLICENKVVGVLSKSTAKMVDGTVFPALSVMTPLRSKSNWKFIEGNLGSEN